MAKIENIYVHTGGLGGQASVHWTIGERRFHVWLQGKDQPEDTVHSNPVVSKNARRDEHRALDRTCKTQAAIWAEVWSTVERDDLIAKRRAEDLAKRQREQRRREAKLEIGEVEEYLLTLFRNGDALIPAIVEPLYAQHRAARQQLAELGAEAE